MVQLVEPGVVMVDGAQETEETVGVGVAAAVSVRVADREVPP
jgi:hypothetical protein